MYHYYLWHGQSMTLWRSPSLAAHLPKYFFHTIASYRFFWKVNPNNVNNPYGMFDDIYITGIEKVEFNKSVSKQLVKVSYALSNETPKKRVYIFKTLIIPEDNPLASPLTDFSYPFVEVDHNLITIYARKSNYEKEINQGCRIWKYVEDRVKRANNSYRDYMQNQIVNKMKWTFERLCDFASIEIGKHGAKNHLAFAIVVHFLKFIIVVRSEV